MKFYRKLLTITFLLILIIQGSINFVNINRVFGQQPSITLKWKADAGTGNTWLGPLAADLNNDGLMEIVITGGYGIAVLDPRNGSVLWRAPYGGSHAPFEIVDLNKDGIPEILVDPEWEYVNGTKCARGGIIALHGNNGSVYWDNPKAYAGGKYIAVADINGDGYPEIFTSSQGGVSALTYDGRIFASAYNYYTCWGGATVGDTDFDGVFEVYVGDRSEWYPSYPSGGRGLRAFWADNLTERWCHPEILCSSHAPVLADVDKDGDLEIIILNQQGGIGVFNTDGSVNTYKGKYRFNLDLGLTCHSNPTVADVDGDGNLELITNGDAKQTLYPPKIWDLVEWKLDATLPFPSMEPPGVADVDGDGKLEIVAPNPQNVTIFKYNPQTKGYDIIHTIPIAYAHEFFIAQDIDNDGKLELVFDLHNGWVYVYDVEAPAPTPKPRSGRYFYSECRTREPVYVPPPGPQEPRITAISPNDGATNIPIWLPELSFKLTDYQCDPINYTVTTNPDIGSASDINVSNGEIIVPVSGLEYSTTYAWTVIATDGIHTTTKTYAFTTKDIVPWYNTDWQYRKEIIIDHMKVAADQTNFPVLIDLTDVNLKTKAQSNGADILFTDQNKVKLSHEIEQYDDTTGRLIVWVNVPYLSSSTSTTLYMYYGNPSCGNQQNSTAMWDPNYKLVMHLNEETSIHYDSTMNGNNGVPYGSLIQGAIGYIGSCVEFNGGYIQLPQVLTTETQFTFSAWIYPRSDSRYIIYEWGSYQGAFLQVSSDGKYIEFYVNNVEVSSQSITLNSWYYIVGTFNGTTAKLYVNGGSPISRSASNPAWPSQNMYIGRNAANTGRFYGLIDEVRVSNVTRSAAWILTEYNNQLNPATFYTLGPEENLDQPCISEPNPADGAKNVSLYLSELSFKIVDYQNDLMNVTVTTNPNIGSLEKLNVPSGTYNLSISSLAYSTTYTWTVIVTDGKYTTTKTYTFTTEGAPVKQYLIIASVEGTGGTINPSGEVLVESDQNQTFLMNPDYGYHVLNVTVDGVPIEPVTSYTFYFVDSNHTIIVKFDLNKYTLTIDIDGEGTVYINPNKTFYSHGETVQLSATPNDGWRFSHWSGDLNGSANPATITVNSNKTITAHFSNTTFQSGYDTGDFSEWTGTSTTSGDSITVVSIDPHHGTYHAQANMSAVSKSVRYAYAYKTVDLSEFYVRFYFKFKDNLPFTTSSDELMLIYAKAGTTVIFQAGFGTARGYLTGSYRSGTTWTDWYNTSIRAELDVWHCIEIYWKKDASNGVFRVYYDGVLVFERTGIDTNQYGNVTEIMVGCTRYYFASAQPLRVFTDCVVVADRYIGPEG